RLVPAGELVRFREVQNRSMIALKALLGVGWFFVAYAVRLYTTVLVEPEINPVKHFPVVTVAHKILLPFTKELLPVFERPLLALGPFIASFIAGPTVFLLPSSCGFLVRELKEHWKLYRASRAKNLGPVSLGHPGEP